MSKSNGKIKAVPNAKSKLIFMLVSIVLMVFSVMQTYYLAMYTLGKEVSEEKLAVYKWVVKLVNYDEKNDVTKQDNNINAE